MTDLCIFNKVSYDGAEREVRVCPTDFNFYFFIFTAFRVS